MQYVALLRGINSGQNPVVKMDQLRRVFESLGFDRVRTILASGNVLFETDKTSEKGLIRRLEGPLSDALGFDVAAIVRTSGDIQRLVDARPFQGIAISAQTKPYVTFLPETPAHALTFPYRAKGSTILGLIDRAVCSVVDLSGATTPDLMRLLEKEFGKKITTRSWNTVERIQSASAASVSKRTTS